MLQTSRLSPIFLRSTALALSLVSFAAPAHAIDANALPAGGKVSNGSADFDYAGNLLNVNQHSNRVVIDWNSFNIGQNATTQFNQSGASAVAVNRVHDINPSQILGNLRANGTVVVLNTNGVVFGQNAKVDVSGLLVSTGDIDADSFMKTGQIALSNINANNGQIVNNGQITIRNSGLAAFVAPQVVNNGIIEANLGKIALASGADKATVDLYGDGLVELALDDKASKALIDNKGTLRANGGKIAITAKAAKGIVDSVINMGGVVEANSFQQKGGVIKLSATNADINVTGKVHALGGGKVSAESTDNIAVSNTADVNVDGGLSGNGGDIYFMADKNATYSGVFSARGGFDGGNGGMVELSARNELGYDGSVFTNAPKGTAGSFLLDPAFTIIHSGSLNNLLGLNYFISAEAIAKDLRNNASVTVQADTFIDVGTNTLGWVPGVGTGNIDVGHYNYNNFEVVGYTNFFGLLIPQYGWVNYNGISTGDLILKSGTVNFNKDLTLGHGNLDIQAGTVNLNSKLYDLNGAGNTQRLLDQGDITTIANTVNVQSPNALIQQGVYLTDTSGTLNIAAGDYTESVDVEKSITIKGANAAIDPNTGVRGAETVITGAGDYVLYLGANNITVDGLTLTNPTKDAVWAYNAGNLGFRNNIITDSDFGLFAWGGTSNNGTVENNLITNIAQHGIYIGENQYFDVLNNTLSGVGVGITQENFYAAKTGLNAARISGNKISASKIGIRNNLFYSNATGFEISGNHITAENPGETRRWTGIDVISLQGGTPSVFMNNTIDGAAVNATRDTAGFELTNLTNGSRSTIDGGSISNVDVGVWATDASFYGGEVKDLLVKGVAFNNIDQAGILVEDVEGYAAANATGTKVTIGAGNTFTNTPYDLAIAGDGVTIGLDAGFNGVGRTLVKAAGNAHYTGTTSNGDTGLTTNNAKINTAIGATKFNGRVTIEDGTYDENVVINKALNIDGTTKTGTIIDPTSGDAITITGNLNASRNVLIRDLTVRGANEGIVVTDGTIFDTLNIRNVDFTGNAYHGLAVYGNGIKKIDVRNSRFLDNGFGGGSGGEGDILAFLYNGDVYLQNVNIQSNTPLDTSGNNNSSDYGIQIRGTNALGASGNITLDNVKVSGKYRVAQLGVQNYSTLSALSLSDVVLGGNTQAGTTSTIGTTWGGLLYLSNIGSNALNLGNTSFKATNNSYIVNNSQSAIDATNALFLGKTGATNTLAENFALEDKVIHALDAAGLGLVTWLNGNVYVTQASNSIQRGVDASSVGGNVWVDHGNFYEAVNVSKSVKIIGSGTAHSTHVIGPNDGTGAGMTINANNVSLSGMVLENWYNGLQVDNASITNLSMDDIVSRHNSYAGFQVTNTGSVDGLIVKNSHFDDNNVRIGTTNDFGYGWMLTKGDNNPANATTVKNVTVTDTTFSGNTQKGIYAEKLSDATFTRVDVINSGTRADNPFSNVGVDINLKNGVYENIKFDDLTVSGSGVDGVREGIAVAIKARNDGATYSALPATLTNVTVTNSSITAAGSNGLAVGNGVNGAHITNNTKISGPKAINIYDGVQNVDITGNTEISSTGTPASGDAYGIALNFVKNILIKDNLDISSVNGNAIQSLWGTGTLVVDNNTITKAGKNGVNLEGSLDTQTVQFNDISNTTENGVRLWNTNGTTVYDNDITTVGGAGIYADGVQGPQISLNTIDDTGSYGIFVKDSSYGSVLIDTNTIDNTGNNAIHVQNIQNLNGGVTRIKNNLIGTSGINDNIYGDGIYVNGAHGVQITGNTINETGATGSWDVGSGIFVLNSDNAIIGGAGADRNTLTNIAWDGIKLAGGTGTTVENNLLDGVERVGIYANGATSLTIRDNDVSNTKLNSHGAIATDGGSTISITGNHINNSLHNGIQLNGTGGSNTISGNFIDFVSNDGIAVTGTSDITTSGNEIGLLAGSTIGNNGITVDGAATRLIAIGNKIKNALNGLVASSSNNVELTSNETTVSDTGLSIDGGSTHTLKKNTITGGKTGIKLRNVATANVGGTLAEANTISGIASGWSNSAINVYGGTDLTISRNKLDNNGGQGIYVEGPWGAPATTLDIIGNRINNTGHNAIYVKMRDGVNIRGNNRINGTTYGSGVALELTNNAKVINNTIENTADAGINLFYGNNDTTIQRNTLTNVRDGIVVGGTGANTDVKIGGLASGNENTITASRYAIWIQNAGATMNSAIKVLGNMILGTPEKGILADHVADLVINGNTISGTSAGADHNGIEVLDSDGARIIGNTVNNAKGNGIYVDSSDRVVLRGNTVDNARRNGIRIRDSRRATVVDNTITGGTNGIRLDRVRRSLVENNKIDGVSQNGIDVNNSRRLTLNDNKIGSIGAAGTIGGNGIDIHNSRFVTASNNLVGQTNVVDGDGIHLSNSRNTTLNTNFVYGNVAGNGISATDSNGLDILTNTIAQVGGNGIQLHTVDLAVLDGNTVTDSKGPYGLYLAGSGSGSVVLTNNTIRSLAGKTGARFESGTIDLTGAANTFTDGENGLEFDGSTVRLAGNSFGSTVFENQTGYYIALSNGALFDPDQPTVLDARQVSFDSFIPGSFILSYQDYVDLNAKLYHYNNDNTLGLIFFTYPGADINDILPKLVMSGKLSGGAPGSVTILGLPFATNGRFSGSFINNLANIAPAAGGSARSLNDIDTAAGGNARDLNDIETAAGSAENAGCWSQVYSHFNASASPVTYSLDGSPAALMSSQSSCGQGI